MDRFYYRSNGLLIDSSFPIKRWKPSTTVTAPATADVVIGLGDVPLSLATPDNIGPTWQIKRECMLIRFPGLLRCLMRGNKHLDLLAEASLEPNDIAEIVLSSIWPLLLMRRGLSVIRASAVLWRGKVVLMVSQSLGGKSTLAVALQQMGLPILCDGLARLSVDAHGKIMVHAECAHPSLWPTAIEALNLPDQLGDQLRLGIAKRRLAIPIVTSSAPMPLAAVIVIAASRPSHPPGIEPIPLIDRVQLIRDFAAWPSMITTLRQTQTYLLAGAAAAQVPWAYFMRADPLACLANDVDQVMHHLATIEPQA